MRKFVLSAVALCFTFGLALAVDVTFVKLDKEKKELTVKEKDSDKEKTYTITDDTKFKAGDKDVPADKAMGRLEKAREGMKMMIEVDGKKVTEIKMGGGKKKKDN